jgi:SAM-dependent methyltransferase
MDSHSYTADGFRQKEEFVRSAVLELKPADVLDVGANTGHFSRLAAEHGARVVAIDTDATCVGTIWQTAHARKLDILPLVVNFARPTPAVGWRNQECGAFLTRADGRFQCVLMLAVLHHLLVSERIPLGEILDVAADITSDALVIEFVGPQDDMFRMISRGRDALFSDLDEKAFEASAASRFTIIRSQRIGARHRWLYFLRKKQD